MVWVSKVMQDVYHQPNNKGRRCWYVNIWQTKIWASRPLKQVAIRSTAIWITFPDLPKPFISITLACTVIRFYYVIVTVVISVIILDIATIVTRVMIIMTTDNTITQ